MKGSAFYGKSNQSPLNKALVGKQGNLPEHLKAEIEAAPGKMYDSPTKMKSPVKGKFIDALKKGEFKKAGKVLSHEAKGIGAGAKEMLDDDYGGRSKGYRMELMYDRAKNKSIRLSKADKAKKNKDDAAKTK